MSPTFIYRAHPFLPLVGGSSILEILLPLGVLVSGSLSLRFRTSGPDLDRLDMIVFLSGIAV